ncbi:TolC family outer membrane protein [Sulfuricurvum sp.]|uniref:TolC family outer membrane protein n=1 Tax=Sulfuricurvum sp. TaxID=2025608 RepID=UPI00260BAA05|nr:TolC family outer membrane protein [Sulfuricurvum sp.]MDD3596898.1 TolC family outer membrane protein [Sulfuricurvum sp.]
MFNCKVSFPKAAVMLSVCAFSQLNALTLQEGVDQALSTHPIVQQQLHNYRATLEDLRTTEAQYLPSLDYSGTIARENTDNENTRLAGYGSRTLNTYQHSLTLTQNLFNGFGTIYEADYNKARILAAANYYIENANDVAYKLVETYINVIKARDLLCIAKANVKFNEEIFTKVNKLYQAGITTRSESEKADTSLSLAKSNYVVAKNNLDDALYNFARIYGTRVNVEEFEDIQFGGEIPTSFEELKAYSHTHNPSVLVREYNEKAARAKKDAAYKDYYPKIDAYARQSWSNNVGGVSGRDDRSAIGLNATYNLYRGGADESQIQKNLSQMFQESSARLETVRELDEQAGLSWNAKNYLSDQLQYLKRYTETSSKTLELYQKEYDLGRRTLLDLLVAQNDYVAAQQQIVTAENNLMFAYYRIYDTMGSLVQNVLGTKTQDYTQKVGLDVLDSNRDKDQDVDNLIFADRQNGKYKRDTE